MLMKLNDDTLFNLRCHIYLLVTVTAIYCQNQRTFISHLNQLYQYMTKKKGISVLKSFLNLKNLITLENKCNFNKCSIIVMSGLDIIISLTDSTVFKTKQFIFKNSIAISLFTFFIIIKIVNSESLLF